MLKAIPVAAALAAAAALVVPTVSRAAETNSVRVSYADLNLASHSGQRLLQRRITFAARVVCELEDSRQLPVAFATNACRNDAIANAQPAYEVAVASAKRGIVIVGEGAALIVSGG
ncbi:MAG TPA: UrcA family protein [Sphingomicrobium sp.]|jgi:UrcA family protein|nr:UrcA family protein [Sphingomicrobium sp.]